MAPSIWSGRQGSLEKGEKRAKVQASPSAPQQAPAARLLLREETVVQKKKILSLLPGMSGFVFSGGFQVSRTVSRLHEC